MRNKEKISKYPKSNRAGLVTLLTISSFFAILVATVPLQAANAQLNPTTVQSLLKTGYTNQYQLKTANAGVLTVLYSIRGGVLVGILGNPALKAGDIVINPGGSGGILTVQIPRFALDAKNDQGQDVPFKVTIDGHGASWQQIQSTNTYRTLAINFGNNNRFIEITGTQVG
ncbi:MAG TPA: hypothetical protein VH500_16860 [Nitrososphaeraceae archaeon]|jgi:hypothetical protein